MSDTRDNDLTGDAAKLAELMSDISEDCWCAGWLVCLEYTLWEMVVNPAAERRYGHSHVTDEQVAELKALSDSIGGWIIYWDDDYEPDAPVEEWGERFVPIAEWLKLWKAFEKRNFISRDLAAKG